MKGKNLLINTICIIISVFFITSCSNNGCEHTFSKWQVSKEGTCISKSIESRTCSKCGYLENKEGSFGEHFEVVDEVVEADCNNTGLTKGSHCKYCEEVIVPQQVIAKQHDYNGGEIISEATCFKKGQIKYTCLKCSNEEIIETEILNHDVNEFYVCNRCDEVFPMNLTEEERELAGQVVSIEDVFLQNEKEEYLLFFSFKNPLNTRVKSSAVIDLEIITDNNESVYKCKRIIKTTDFGYYDNKTYGKRFLCCVSISKSEISLGTIISGQLNFNVYNKNYFEFLNRNAKIEKGLPLKNSYIEISNMPREISTYYGEKVLTTVKITNVNYKIEESVVHLYFSGEKLYDYKGEDNYSSCSLRWRIFDEEGNFIDGDIFSSTQIKVGETFKDNLDYSFKSLGSDKVYYLEFFDYYVE